MVKIKQQYKLKTISCERQELDKKIEELQEKGCFIKCFGISDIDGKGYITHSIIQKPNREEEIKENEEYLASLEHKEAEEKNVPKCL